MAEKWGSGGLMTYDRNAEHENFTYDQSYVCASCTTLHHPAGWMKEKKTRVGGRGK